MKTKPKKLYLVRDVHKGHDKDTLGYHLFARKPRLIKGESSWWEGPNQCFAGADGDLEDSFLADWCGRNFPLPWGGGPLKIRLTVEVV